MSRARLTITFTVEYEIRPENYPADCDTDDKRVLLDMQAAEEDPLSFVEDVADAAVSGEVVP